MTRTAKRILAAPLYVAYCAAMPVAYVGCAVYLIAMFGPPNLNPFSRRP